MSLTGVEEENPRVGIVEAVVDGEVKLVNLCGRKEGLIVA